MRKSNNPCTVLKNTSDFLKNFPPISLSRVHYKNIVDFEVLGFLGKGAFGKVYLVRRLLTNDKYAMKVIKIYEGLDSRKIENIAN